MTNYYRDAILALVALAALLGVLVVRGEVSALGRPLAIGVGVASALPVEIAFLRSGMIEQAWNHPVIRAGCTLGVITGGLAAYATVGPPVPAALCWGLATYFVLLGAVLALDANPLAAVR